MFTGLIETVGTLEEAKPTSTGLRVRVNTAMGSDLRPGDSVAVNGVCLTVIAADAQGFFADISPETVRVSTLGTLQQGAALNLERPLRADARLGGHFVQGHVDAVGVVDEIRQEGDWYWLTVKFPPALAPCIVRKGSIAVDGISLTVAGVDDRRFDVQIIPYTWLHTNLQGTRQDDRVNLECDLLGKYVVRAMELRGG